MKKKIHCTHEDDKEISKSFLNKSYEISQELKIDPELILIPFACLHPNPNEFSKIISLVNQIVNTNVAKKLIISFADKKDAKFKDVKKHVKETLIPWNTNPFTAEENQILLNLTFQYKRKWKKI
jgi:hypothetical protein